MALYGFILGIISLTQINNVIIGILSILTACLALTIATFWN